MVVRKTVFLAAAVILTVGCTRRDSDWKPSESSIFIGRDRHVESALVYTAERDNDLYTQEKLASYIEEAVEQYNAEYKNAKASSSEAKNPEKLVEVRSCSLEGQTGTVIFSYSSPEEFVRFSEITGDDTHTVTSLQVEGTDQPKKHSVSVQLTGCVRISTDGKILETSEQGVTLLDDHTAVTDEGEHYIIFH